MAPFKSVRYQSTAIVIRSNCRYQVVPTVWCDFYPTVVTSGGGGDIERIKDKRHVTTDDTRRTTSWHLIYAAQWIARFIDSAADSTERSLLNRFKSVVRPLSSGRCWCRGWERRRCSPVMLTTSELLSDCVTYCMHGQPMNLLTARRASTSEDYLQHPPPASIVTPSTYRTFIMNSATFHTSIFVLFYCRITAK